MITLGEIANINKTMLHVSNRFSLLFVWQSNSVIVLCKGLKHFFHLKSGKDFRIDFLHFL